MEIVLRLTTIGKDGKPCDEIMIPWRAVLSVSPIRRMADGKTIIIGSVIAYGPGENDYTCVSATPELIRGMLEATGAEIWTCLKP